MPSPAPAEDHPRSPVPGSNLRDFRALHREQLPALRFLPAYISVLRRSCVCLLECRSALFYLHQGSVCMRVPLVELLQRVLALIITECSLYHPPEAAQCQETVEYGRRLITTAHHAVRTFGIAAPYSVFFPFCRFHQFLEALGISILQQVARLLPAEDV